MKNVGIVMFSLCMALATSSVFAQDSSMPKDTMSHDAMAKTDTMHSDMKKNAMAHDAMKKGAMSNDTMAKTAMTKNAKGGDAMKGGMSHDTKGDDSTRH